MPSIESIGHPLAFKVGREVEFPADLRNRPDEIAVRAEIRALEGMQKEAVVYYGPTGTVWRMVSDEGPYLNGTDLAPFPLAFYTAGMAFSFVSEIQRHARAHNVGIESLQVTQDNYYTMEGSALRGDMVGGARPVELLVQVETEASPETVAEIVRLAEASSPAQAYMRDRLSNTFALCLNGRQLPVSRVAPSPVDPAADPKPKFDTIEPASSEAFAPDIITKLESAETVFDAEGGAGSSLKSEQKRTLHVRGIAILRHDGLKEVLVQLFKPIGSSFRFLSDETEEMGAQEQAPSSLAYLAAGVGFCYMTQLGRYAQIVKQDLRSYRIVQDNVFKLQQSDSAPVPEAVAKPVDTHVFVTFDESEEAAQKLVSMGEQTCFLHAAMRTTNPTQIQVELNGEPVALN
jgi:uncharacterized OsmC-like protein